uniref:Tail assembly chaperone n=1 Tax=viral metagenome TaxID=1070528 RepID=A0A6M3JIK7_9ZZZZ
MAILDKAALLTPSDLKCETVTVGSGEVVMQEFSWAERIRAREELQAMGAGDDEQSARALLRVLVVPSLRNEDRSVMFPPEERDEAVVGLMAALPPASIMQLIDGGLHVQGMGKDILKEAVGNSEATRSDSSPSGSPETSATPASAS